MKKVFLFVFSVFSFLTVSCTDLHNPETDDSKKSSGKVEYGSITVDCSGDRSAITDIKYAKVFVTGENLENEEDQPQSDFVSVASGKASGIKVSNIPVGKNRIVKVYGYNATKQKLSDQVISAVYNIETGSNTIIVNESTTALGRVFDNLLTAGYKISEISSDDKQKLSDCIKTGLEPSKIRTLRIASDYRNGGVSGLKSQTSYVVSEDTGKVSNCNNLRIYQIMVSCFQDGDSKIGFTSAYGPSTSYASEMNGEEATVHGGDLQGIINSVEYIKNLGVNAIWLTPVFQSTGSNEIASTGYYAYDYFNVDNRFGTNAKLAELVDTYHEHGINVILDGVFGHHGDSVAASPTDYVNKYVETWKVNNPGIKPSLSNPVDYAGDANSLKFYQDVAEFWIRNYKIDGWRLDQCYQVGLGDKIGAENNNCSTDGHNYWYDIRKSVESAAASNGSAGSAWGTLGYMVGEHWDGNASNIQKGSINPGTAGGYGLKSCFDFPDRYTIVNALAEAEYDAGGNQLGSALASVYKTPSEKGYYHPEGYIPNLFITNHDLVRFGNLLNWDEGLKPTDERYWKMHQIMLACLAAYTGPITIFYGDEWGAYAPGETSKPTSTSTFVGNSAYVDCASRTSGKISGFSTNEQKLLEYAQNLMLMRSEHEALWNGDYTTITTNGELYVGKKSTSSESIIFAINNQNSSQNFNATGTDLITGERVSGTASVGAYAARFILCQ